MKFEKILRAELQLNRPFVDAYECKALGLWIADIEEPFGVVEVQVGLTGIYNKPLLSVPCNRERKKSAKLLKQLLYIAGESRDKDSFLRKFPQQSKIEKAAPEKMEAILLIESLGDRKKTKVHDGKQHGKRHAREGVDLEVIELPLESAKVIAIGTSEVQKTPAADVIDFEEDDSPYHKDEFFKSVHQLYEDNQKTVEEALTQKAAQVSQLPAQIEEEEDEDIDATAPKAPIHLTEMDFLQIFDRMRPAPTGKLEYEHLPYDILVEVTVKKNEGKKNVRVLQKCIIHWGKYFRMNAGDYKFVCPTEGPDVPGGNNFVPYLIFDNQYHKTQYPEHVFNVRFALQKGRSWRYDDDGLGHALLAAINERRPQIINSKTFYRLKLTPVVFPNDNGEAPPSHEIKNFRITDIKKSFYLNGKAPKSEVTGIVDDISDYVEDDEENQES